MTMIDGIPVPLQDDVVDRAIKAIQEFRAANPRTRGNIPNFDLHYVTADGFELGHWRYYLKSLWKQGRGTSGIPVEIRKRFQDELSSFDHRAIIDSRTMSEYREMMIIALQEYIDEFGHAIVPTGYVNKNGVTLGAMINRAIPNATRNGAGSYFYDTLESMGAFIKSSAPSKPSDVWRSLIKVYEEAISSGVHPHIPASYVTSNGVHLGSWSVTVRDHYKTGRLSQEAIDKLTELDFPWETPKLIFPSRREIEIQENIGLQRRIAYLSTLDTVSTSRQYGVRYGDGSVEMVGTKIDADFFVKSLRNSSEEHLEPMTIVKQEKITLVSEWKICE